MSDNRWTGEKILDALQDIRNEEFATLLEDVTRIANGVGAVQQLAIRAFGEPDGRDKELLDPADREVVWQAHKLRREAESGNRGHVAVPRVLLTELLAIVDRHVRT